MKDRVLLRNASLFDVEESVFRANMDILIEGEKIKAVDRGLQTDKERSTEIECSGRFVLPGLFECHAHLTVLTSQPEREKKEILKECAVEGADSEDELDKQVLQAFVERGITQIRDCGGPVRTLQAMRNRITKGEYDGPDLFYAGPMLEKSPLTGAGNNERWPDFTVPVDSEIDAESIVEEISGHGASLVKTFGKFDEDVLKHLLGMAKEHNLPVTYDPGKTFFHPIPVDRAIDLGIECVEHGKSPWYAVLRDDLRQEHDSLRAADQQAKEVLVEKLFSLGVDSISETNLRRLARRMVKEGVHLCPTLHVFKHYAEHPEQFSQADLDKFARRFRVLHDVARFITREMAVQGVRILVGHDGWNPQFTFEEMLQLKDVGLSESEIIRGSTIYPSRWLGVADQLGSVSPGKKANILILNQNPLEDIENIKTAYAVLQGGKIVFQE